MEPGNKNYCKDMSVKKTSSSSFHFAKAFEELEMITQWFESDVVDVDEALKKFERGLALAKACKEKLSEVENKVEQIKKQFVD